MVSFFFFKQKTAYEVRISDWSSDVCSSDLQFLRRIAVEAHHPVGLVEPMFAHQRRTLQGQHAAGRGDGGEGAVIDPPQPVPAVERTGPPDDGAVVRLVRADDHLGGLAGRGEARRMGVRSEEHTSELQSLMRISYAVFCLKNKRHAADR